MEQGTRDSDVRWMQVALRLARWAGRHGEVPVGALLVSRQQCVAVAANRREARSDVLGHAEVVAVQRAAGRWHDWRLDGCTLYVTLEPCAMCAGVLLEARVGRVVFGAYDRRAGAAGSVLNLLDYPGLPARTELRGGVLQKDCEAVLEDFFRSRRNIVLA